MIFTVAMTPPACYGSVSQYYVDHRERGPFHTTILYDGDYALVQWSGTHSGGQGAFRRRGGRWCVLVNGGGAMNAGELARYGVPRANAMRLLARMRRSEG
jgi:hypothetical protein